MTRVIATRDIDRLAAAKLAAIRAEARARMQAILDQYPEHERAGWERQLAAARAYQADTSTVPTLLQTLADRRGVTVSEMADKIIAKAEQFETLYADVVGTQQSLEDQVRAAKATGDKVGVLGVTDWPSA